MGTPLGETLFIGLYEVLYRGLLEEDTPMPHKDGIDKAGSCEVYDLTLQSTYADLIGNLYIDWGPGMRAWIQRADKKNKPIIKP